MWDLGVPQCSATVLYEDNDTATAMANAQKPTSRTRHMDIKFKVLCEWVELDLVQLERVDTTLNMANHFTKQLGPILFQRHNDYILGHVPPPYSSEYQWMRGLVHQKTTVADDPVMDTSHCTIAAAAARLSVDWSLVTEFFQAPLYVQVD